jgi:hypothetical protein
MSIRSVQVDDRRWILSMEAPLDTGRAPWAIVQARATDELTGAAVDAPVRIVTARRGLTPRAAPGGLVALAGMPVDALPRLRLQHYTVSFSIHADGYLPLRGEAVLPQDPQFPGRFVPARLGDLPLHRQPVVIAGRVTRRVGGTVTGVAVATVSVTEIWPVLPPADGSVPSHPPLLLSLHPPMYAGRPAAIGQLRRRNVTPVLGHDRSLLDDVAEGSEAVRVSDRVGLAVGVTVLVDADPALQELASVQAVAPVGAPDLPARLVFAHPLAFFHRRGARVRVVTPQPSGALHPFNRPASGGDICVFLNSMTGLSTAQEVEVIGGGPAPELHRSRRFVTQSDAEGRYRLPPLHRVAQLTVRATAGASTADVSFVPDYTRTENRLDISL